MAGLTGRDATVDRKPGDQLPWAEVPEGQRNKVLQSVRHVLSGGTAEQAWEIHRSRPENVVRNLPEWESVPATQRVREELVFASINAMAMVLGHSKRPFAEQTVVAVPRPG
jgi:hypothetical protein